jgi:hypothetical protein
MFEEMSATRVSLVHLIDEIFIDLLTNSYLITWKATGFL